MTRPRWTIDWRLWLAVGLAILVALLAVIYIDGARERAQALRTLATRDHEMAALRHQLDDRDATAASERAHLNERVDQLVAQLTAAGITPAPEPPPTTTEQVLPPRSSPGPTTTTPAPRPTSTTTTTTSPTTTTTKPPAPCTTLPLTGACLARNTPNHR